MRSRADSNEGKGSPGAARVVFALLPVIVAFTVGVAWFLLAFAPEGWTRYDLLFILTLGVAIAFGASMSMMRGFAMSTVLAAAAIVGNALGEGDVIGWLEGDGTVDPAEVMSFWLVSVLGTTIFVLAFWLIGVTIVTMWHGSTGRLVQQALRRGLRR